LCKNNYVQNLAEFIFINVYRVSARSVNVERTDHFTSISQCIQAISIMMTLVWMNATINAGVIDILTKE
jgi:hypothetical protein